MTILNRSADLEPQGFQVLFIGPSLIVTEVDALNAVATRYVRVCGQDERFALGTGHLGTPAFPLAICDLNNTCSHADSRWESCLRNLHP